MQQQQRSDCRHVCVSTQSRYPEGNTTAAAGIIAAVAAVGKDMGTGYPPWVVGMGKGWDQGTHDPGYPYPQPMILPMAFLTS